MTLMTILSSAFIYEEMGKISGLIDLNHQHSMTTQCSFISSTLKDTLMSKNIGDLYSTPYTITFNLHP